MVKNLSDNKIIAIFIAIITFFFLTSNFFVIEAIKKEKRSQKINIEELKNMSKEEILEYINQKQKSSFSLWILDFYYLIIALISYFSGFITSYLLFKRTEVKKEKEIKEKIIKIFPIKYRKVIEELVKSNGEETQALLRQKLGLDKVQMTRLIKRMEEEGFIKVKRGSKINIIELNEDLKKLLI